MQYNSTETKWHDNKLNRDKNIGESPKNMRGEA